MFFAKCPERDSGARVDFRKKRSVFLKNDRGSPDLGRPRGRSNGHEKQTTWHAGWPATLYAFLSLDGFNTCVPDFHSEPNSIFSHAMESVNSETKTECVMTFSLLLQSSLHEHIFILKGTPSNPELVL